MAAESPFPAQRRESGPRITLGRRRSRATLACANCRARKVRCDVQTSQEHSCTPCRLSDTRCVFNAHDDRRKFGSRAQMAAIQGQLMSIESFMRQAMVQDGSEALRRPLDTGEGLSITDPPNATIHHRPPLDQIQSLSNLILPKENNQFFSNASIAGSLGCPKTSLDSEAGATPSNVPQLGHVSSEAEVSYPHERQACGRDLNPAINTHPRPNPPNSTPSFLRKQRARTSNVSTTSTTLLEDDPAQTWEADSVHGPLRFWGLTARPHSQLVPINSPQTEKEGDYGLQAAPNLDSPRLQKALFDAFWDWNDLKLTLNIVDEAMFTMQREVGSASQYYSRFLEDVILACGSRMSSSFVIRQLGKKYAKRAKEGLEQQLESPTISSLQGFLLLSDFESTRGSERVGWTYGGIAIRMVFDLGLHEDCSELVEQGKLKPEEAKIRKMLFFCAFQHDALWSLYFGRPSTISITVASAMFNAAGRSENRCPNTPTLEPWISHCIIVSEIAGVLNAPGQLGRDALNRLSQLCAATTAAYESLPPVVKYRDSEISELDSSAYALNMQYCGLQIVLHRIPVLLRHRRRIPDASNFIQSTLPGFTKQDSDGIKRENALKIVQLLHTFVQIYGIERIHSVMLDCVYLAASALTHHILSAQNQNSPPERDTQRLRLLSSTMESAQKHYPVVARMRRTLSTTVENTPLSTIFNPRSDSNAFSDDTVMSHNHFMSPQMNRFDDTFMSDLFLEPLTGTTIAPDLDFNHIPTLSW